MVYLAWFAIRGSVVHYTWTNTKKQTSTSKPFQKQAGQPWYLSSVHYSTYTSLALCIRCTERLEVLHKRNFKTSGKPEVLNAGSSSAKKQIWYIQTQTHIHRDYRCTTPTGINLSSVLVLKTFTDDNLANMCFSITLLSFSLSLCLSRTPLLHTQLLPQHTLKHYSSPIKASSWGDPVQLTWQQSVTTVTNSLTTVDMTTVSYNCN